MVSYAEVAIIATTVQAVLTGAYFATFLLCLRWQIFPDKPDYASNTSKNLKWSMLIVSIIVFALSMADIGISLEASLLAVKGSDTPLFAGVIAVRGFSAHLYRCNQELVPVCRRSINSNYHRLYSGS